MQGFWEDAMGIPGFEIGDVAVQLNANYELLLETGLPSAFGLIGSMIIGRDANAKKITLGGFFDTQNAQDIALQGKFDGKFHFNEMLETCETFAINVLKKAGGNKNRLNKINKDFSTLVNAPVIKQMLDMGFENVNITAAPETVQIGEIIIMQGCTIKGTTILLGEKAMINSSISQSGVVAEGSLSPIIIGDFFKFTGAGLDKKYGTADDAAIISMAANFQAQHLIISGLLEFMGIQAQTDISLDKDGFNCYVDGKLFNLFDASVHIYSHGSIKSPDLSFKAVFKNDLF